MKGATTVLVLLLGPMQACGDRAETKEFLASPTGAIRIKVPDDRAAEGELEDPRSGDIRRKPALAGLVEFAGLTPGRYGVNVEIDGAMKYFPEVDLRAGDAVDLTAQDPGDPAHVVVELGGDARPGIDAIMVELRTATGRRVDPSPKFDGESARSRLLFPDTYEVVVVGPSFARIQRKVELLSGRDAHFLAELSVGQSAFVFFEFPGAREPEPVQVEVNGPGGFLLRETSKSASNGQQGCVLLGLASGEYEVRGTVGDLSGNGHFEIAEPKSVPMQWRIVLRPFEGEDG